MNFGTNRVLSDEQVEVENIKLACANHAAALLKNLRKRLKLDDYGNTISDERPAEAEKFLRSIGLSFRTIGEISAIKLVLTEAEKLADQRANEGFVASDVPVDGFEFEQWGAEALQKFGWKAQATQGSGDQGIDVVATKEGINLGIQCKRYAGSVGNKAVQEAYSGAKHMGLEHAAVLTNAEFTKSAKELAASTGVLLLSPEDIPTLFEVLTQGNDRHPK